MAKAKVGRSSVSDFSALHDRLSKYRGWFFRGHADQRWRLVPKAGRAPFNRQPDKKLFDGWKRKASEYLRSQPESDWEWLAVAQHHGLATRLLDWTINPLVAAYFAVCEKCDGPAVIIAARFKQPYDRSADLESRHQKGPFESDGIAVLQPRHWVSRITRQGGLFTIHSPRDRSVEDLANDASVDFIELERILITETYRARLRSELAFYGINSASLFPDLDGLSQFMNWTVESDLFVE